MSCDHLDRHRHVTGYHTTKDLNVVYHVRCALCGTRMMKPSTCLRTRQQLREALRRIEEKHLEILADRYEVGKTPQEK